MTKLQLPLLLLCCLTFIVKLNGQINTDNYLIYDVKSAKICTLDDIAESMKNHDILLFGEEHNDVVTHFLQNKLLELLFEKYKENLTLSMEMFDRDVQPVLDEYLMDKIKEKHFKKDARAWSNYDDYKPMLEFAKAKKVNIIAANSASRYANLAGREGIEGLKSLPKKTQTYFAPLPYEIASGKYLEKLNQMMGLSSHDSLHQAHSAAMMGGFNLVVAQSLWDATMAFSIAEHLKKNKGKKILHLNGRFHSDEKLGIYTQLKKYAPKAKVLVISSFSSDDFPETDLTQWKHLGDFIIITDPNVPKSYD
jgi:uncharacterized iron-regulated protein